MTTMIDADDWRRSVSAAGLLREFNDAGVLEPSDVLVAQRITRLAKESSFMTSSPCTLVWPVLPRMFSSPALETSRWMSLAASMMSESRSENSPVAWG